MKQLRITFNDGTTDRLADFDQVVSAEMGTAVSKISSTGAHRWRSPELLDSPRFGSDRCVPCESDDYVLGMIAYEVSWLRSPSMATRPCPPR